MSTTTVVKVCAVIVAAISTGQLAALAVGHKEITTLSYAVALFCNICWPLISVMWIRKIQ